MDFQQAQSQLFKNDHIAKQAVKNPNKVADILVVASFGELLPKEYLSNFDLCVNVHPSALPKWRGANPLQSAILAGDSSAKVTIQSIAEKFDHGKILTQSEEVPISRKVCKTVGQFYSLKLQNTFTLGLELGQLGGEKVLDIIDNYNDLTFTEQVGKVTYTKKVSHKALLDIEQSAETILRQYCSGKLPHRMPFFNKSLFPINLQAGAIIQFKLLVQCFCWILKIQTDFYHDLDSPNIGLKGFQTKTFSA